MRLLLLIFLSLSLSSRADESAVHELIDGFHNAAANSEFENYFSRFTGDGYFLGTDAAERWTVGEFREYARVPFAEGRGWRYEVQSRNLESIPGLDAWWFDEVLLNAALGRCRGTGVVVREAGEWRIAHYSLTLLIPNEIADEVGSMTRRVDGLDTGYTR